MARNLLLTESEHVGPYSRTITRRGGLIRDVWPTDAEGRRTGLAVVQCVHGNVWPEGGSASDGNCRTCLDATQAVWSILQGRA